MNNKKLKKCLLAMLCVSAMFLGSVRGFTVLADETTQKETLDETLKLITFSKFGIANGTYGVDTKTGLAASGQYRDSLDGTVLSGKVRFSNTPDAMLIYGGNDDPWHGLQIRSSNGDGTLTLLNTHTNTPIMNFEPSLAGAQGLQLTDNDYNLKLSMEYVDHDGDQAEDDVKLGVWFEDVLYKNEYIYIDDLAPKLGSCLSVYVSNEASSLKLESVQLNEKLETIASHMKGITVRNFGVADGKYKFTEAGMPKTGYEVSGGYVFSLEDTYFSADVEFSSVTGASLHYGGEESPWHGIRLDIMWDGSMRVNKADFNPDAGDKIYYLYSGIAGVQLTDTRYNLKLTTEFVDYDGDGAEDDVKFGIWFNNVLYNQEYIYFPNLVPEMGGNFTICSSQDNPESYIYVKSDPSVKTEVDFSLYGFTKSWNKELGKEI